MSTIKCYDTLKCMYVEVEVTEEGNTEILICVEHICIVT